jgi:hypothetical protein
MTFFHLRKRPRVENKVARFSKQKGPLWVNFGGSCNGRRWCILRPFGIFYGHLVYFTAIWYIFSGFSMLYQKSLATLVEKACLPKDTTTELDAVIDYSLQNNWKVRVRVYNIHTIHIPKWRGGGLYQIPIKLPNGHKIYQMSVIYSIWP